MNRRWKRISREICQLYKITKPCVTVEAKSLALLPGRVYISMKINASYLIIIKSSIIKINKPVVYNQYIVSWSIKRRQPPVPLVSYFIRIGWCMLILVCAITQHLKLTES